MRVVRELDLFMIGCRKLLTSQGLIRIIYSPLTREHVESELKMPLELLGKRRFWRGLHFGARQCWLVQGIQHGF
jgi:hypothetical protein